MSKLRLITGPSGSGKSTGLYEEILKRAAEERGRNFFFIVPDQAAMSTQKALVSLSPVKGILNIDVLGFSRLSHRILEETGQEDIPVLDDTGMNLILQKVSSSASGELPYLGRRLGKSGMILEVKSALSEFMQYGIDPSGMDALIDSSALRGALKGKLKDLKRIYELFEQYIKGHYITREEKLDILCSAIPDSSLLPDSVMVFDGFTGFTPVQMKVISALMGRCSEMVFTLEASEGEDVREEAGCDHLFYLSHKTALGLIKLAGDAGMDIAEPEMKKSLIPDPDIALLERNLFRFGRAKSHAGGRNDDNPGLKALGENVVASSDFRSVQIMEMSDPASEARYIGVKIRDLIEKEGYAYRDFAVAVCDIGSYAPYFEKEFDQMGIPVFMDSVNKVALNSLTETVTAVLDIEATDYSPESVTRFLKGGLAGIDAGDIDLLDNYIRQTGVRGYRAWHSEFTRTVRSRKNDKEYLPRINSIRKKVISVTEKIEGNGGRITRDKAGEYVKRLYELLLFIEAPEKIRDGKRGFEEEGQAAKVREDSGVWKQLIDLFDKIYELVGEEEVTLDQFADIVSAGISEMRVPMIPKSVDRVLVGDITRSRLQNIKVLFIAGANDGNIPKNASSKGLISDLDREYLAEQGIELSPTPVQQMYIQRQYLYMNMCKPSDRLFISYGRVRADGKSARPSYLIPMVKKLLPYTEKVIRPDSGDICDMVSSKEDALMILASLMREYADKGEDEGRKGEVFSLYAALDGEGRERILSSVYKRYLDNPLADEIVRKLYPGAIEGSVSSLETYASCPYRYFLDYGLKIRPTESFEIAGSDRGTLAHDILKSFSDALSADGLTWTAFTDEYAGKVIPEIASERAASYGSSVYFASKRNEYNISRLSRLVLSSALFIREQLKAGSFSPAYFEKPFEMTLELEGGRQLHMSGTIDRVDIAQDGEKKYLQVIDYKSGKKDMDLSRLIDGRQIQIPLYMYKVREDTGGEAASMLYFHIQDPITDVDAQDDLGKVLGDRRSEMKPKGELSSDADALKLIDRKLGGLPSGASSDYYPVSLKRDGDFNTYSRVLPPSVMDMILKEAVEVSKKEAEGILKGCISVNPYRSSCKYCPFASACGIDRKLPGYKVREDKKLKRNEAVEDLIKKYGKKSESDDSDDNVAGHDEGTAGVENSNKGGES